MDHKKSLNQTTYTQPAIYLIGYSICEILKKKQIFLKKKLIFSLVIHWENTLR